MKAKLKMLVYAPYRNEISDR